MASVILEYADRREEISAEAGQLLSALLLDREGAPHMFCGGKGTCGKCRVRAFGALSPLGSEEKKFLTEEEIASGMRLSCLTKVLGDCRVVLAADTKLENISVAGCMPEFDKKPMFRDYGVAVDIGTTTVVAQLYGKEGLIRSVSSHNPQRSFGADVISRIGKALEGHGPALAACVQRLISQMIAELEAGAGLPEKSVDALVITGNTAMLYLFTGRNPDCLSHAPFEADCRFGMYVEPKQLNLALREDAKVYLPRCMSAFVGADITTAVFAGEIAEGEKSKFLIDIGTNGEMALWHDEKLLCCSTAAGPTFEGAGITMGMQGSAGAVDHVSVQDGALSVHVIGDTAAKGICGSGIVDAVSAMLTLEAIDENGLMEDEDEFHLTDQVYVDQKDIRMVQLAKSAICAGALTLLDEAGVSAEELFSLSIAGGFGSYLDLAKAAHIGLYPKALEEKAIVLGNAALSGAAMILLNRDFAAATEALADAAETVELTTSPTFMDYYVDCMMFE